MSTELTMPKLGLTMKTGKVARWLVAEGACVHQGDEIFEVETDKITNKVESPADGVVHILVPQGEVVEVGTVLGLLGEAGEAVAAPAQGASAPAAAPSGDAEEEGAASPAAAQAAAPAQASGTSWILATPRARALARFLELDLRHVTPTGANGRIREADVVARQDVLSRIAITPLARVLASQAGLDICTLTGSGEGGKIVRADVERALNPEAAQAAPAAAAAAESAAADVRELVLEEAGGASPVRTLSATVDMTACQQLLGDMKRLGAQYKKAAAELDLGLIMALVAARTLAAHPALNAVYGNGRLVRERSVQLALRTMPAGSDALLADAQDKGLLALAADRKAARAGSSTFVLTSFTGSRVERATPSLGAGQAAGLALGAPVQRAVSCNGSLALTLACDVTLGYDARMVTDAEACAFMDALVAAADNPLLLVF
ncbi:MAG TPA: E3 binding domain-containing protein [Candidatus Desulfovibrio intestinipullorum]|uniref:Dihydrolipoamide acetyltransferase component of pyruvate dehydrogenase complex n=1 Tax=Candidatus Desulfovibrio intestinipullorum TaxID=2838536 RepID=A0A9D1TQZ9_9BACT|nr:E3 binding domain-containing protein [Candidatus Desulfovibrio intestinipullorum]